MLKTLFSASAVAAICIVTPASAQMMCGPGQQAQASGQGGGMMCGMMASPAQAKPEGEAQKPQAGGMCPCCRNMASMMRRGSGGSMDHHLPGMEMPKQQ